jgi:three-Cys-motif partner protein
VFIEKTRTRFRQLRRLKAEFPHLARRITLVQGDSNERLQEMSQKRDWRRSRAVLFLDPFAMQLEWETLEAVAATEAMDTWILWPIMAMNRLLEHAGRIPESWRLRMNRFLGTEKWYDEFYRVREGRDLFGTTIDRIEKVADFEALSQYLNRRLGAIFAAVAENPRILRNSRGTPLFLFCFAAANPRGAPIAKRIAEHILKEF